MKNDIKKYKEQRANKYGNSKIDGKSKINYEKIISDIEKKYPNFSKKINSIHLQNQPSTSNTKSKSPQM